MRCKQVEKLIIESTQIDLDQSTITRLENHLSECEKCFQFKEYYQNMRLDLQRLNNPSLSEELNVYTKLLCQTELKKQYELIAAKDQKKPAVETPLPVWMALIFLFVVTVIWAFPIMSDYFEDRVITEKTISVIMLVIQNVLALMYAPIILQTLKAKKLLVKYN